MKDDVVVYSELESCVYQCTKEETGCSLKMAGEDLKQLGLSIS